MRMRADTRRFEWGVASARAVVAFPLTVWLLWRLSQAVVLLMAGGDLVDDAFRFDGAWFLNILQHGYAVTDASYDTQQNVAFFPGLVWLTEPFSWVVGDRSSALLIANITGATAFVSAYGAIRCVTGSERLARRSTIALAVWPASVVMTAYYSEGLFVTMTAAAIWAADRDRYRLGGLAAFVAAITRSIGFLLGPILAVARCIRLRRVDRAAVIYAFSGPVGLGVVAATQAVQVDDAGAFAKAQEGWDRAFAAPWEPIYRATDGIIDKLPKPAMELGLNLAAILFVGASLAMVTVRLRAKKSTWGFLGWGWVAWFTPLWTAVPSSHVRFAIAAWPALAVAGDDDSHWGRRIRIAAAVASVAISVVLVRRWATGEFIG